MRILIYSLLFIMIVVALFLYIGIQQVVVLPEIQLSSNELHFTIDSTDHATSKQIIQITNSKGGILNWHIRTEEAQRNDYWFEILPPHGTCGNGRSKKVEIGINPNRLLQPGQYHCTLLVMGDTSEIERKKIDVYVDATQLPVKTKPIENIFKILRVPEEYSSIKEAIVAASNGDKIIVGQGTYYENLSIMGKDIVLQSAKPNDAYAVSATVIRGTMKAGSVLTFSGTESAKCVVSGFTIIAGDAKYGGAINGNGTHATLLKCVIWKNSTEYGGPIHNFRGLIAICRIEDNH